MFVVPPSTLMGHRNDYLVVIKKNFEVINGGEGLHLYYITTNEITNDEFFVSKISHNTLIHTW